MKIEQKLGAFIDGEKIDCLPISIEDLKSINIHNTKHLKNLKGWIFEESVMLSSGCIFTQPNMFIGAYSYMNDGGYLRNNTFIGRYCSIGRRVTIGAGIHKMNGLSTSPAVRGSRAKRYTAEEIQHLGFSNKTRHPNTILMNDVWVGDGVVIMPGVTVSTGAVVGANSVVTKDIPPYAIVGGCPARIIKYRFPEEVVEELLRTEWWELPKATISDLPTGNVLEFIDVTKNTPRIDKNSGYNSYMIDIAAA